MPIRLWLDMSSGMQGIADGYFGLCARVAHRYVNVQQRCSNQIVHREQRAELLAYLCIKTPSSHRSARCTQRHLVTQFRTAR